MSSTAAKRTTPNDPFTIAQSDAAEDSGTGTPGTWSVRSGSIPERTVTYTDFDTEARGATLAKQMQRELVRQTAPEERQRFYEEHAYLIDRKFGGGLSTREQQRLTYVRWQLDRFEDADIGDRLDELEELTVLHRQIAEEVTAFAESAVVASKTRGRR